MKNLKTRIEKRIKHDGDVIYDIFINDSFRDCKHDYEKAIKIVSDLENYFVKHGTIEEIKEQVYSNNINFDK